MEKTAKMLQISVLLNSRRQIYSPLLLEQLMEEEKKPPSEAWKPASGADVTPLSWNWRNTASSAGRYCFIFHICRTYSLLDSFFFLTCRSRHSSLSTSAVCAWSPAGMRVTDLVCRGEQRLQGSILQASAAQFTACCLYGWRARCLSKHENNTAPSNHI